MTTQSKHTPGPVMTGHHMRSAIESEVKAASAQLKALRGTERGPMGLTPDHIKFSPEYRAAKQAYAVAFAKLRRFNSGARP